MSTVLEIDHLYNWLAKLELSEYYAVFQENHITYELLPAVDKSVLHEIGVYKVGDLVKLLVHIRELKMESLAGSVRLGEVVKLVGDRLGEDLQQTQATAPAPAPAQALAQSHSNITFILQDGSTRTVNVEGCFNSDSIKRKVLKKLSLATAKLSQWSTYLVDSQGEVKLMYDIELVTVCHSVEDPQQEKQRIILCPHAEKPSPKLVETSQRVVASGGGERVASGTRFGGAAGGAANPLPPPRQRQRVGATNATNANSSGTNNPATSPDSSAQLRSFFGQRPPSELISNNLLEYFPDTRLDTLQETVVNSVRMSRLMSSPRFSMISDRPLSTVSFASTLSHRVGHHVPNQRLSVWSRRSRVSSVELAREAEWELGLDDESILSALSMEDEAGPQNWLKGAKIGAGSFGTVYLGMNLLTGELMAVKQVEMPAVAERQKHHVMMIDLLKQEMSLLRNLHHENIVSYLGSNSDSQHLNIFLEYVPGGSVTTMLNNYGPFEEPLIRNFIRQILNGLSYLHGEHIIHRDIKGANVLIDIKGTVKISDFGISKKMLGSGELLQLSSANKRSSLQGSVYWMAPEVVKQTLYTPKLDIWSVGCLVVEMFTGKHPFPDFSQMQLIFKIGTHTRPVVPAWATDDLKLFLERTFELDYLKRPSAKELMADAFLDGLIIAKK